MVCECFRPSVTTSPAAANRPMDLIFGMYMDIGDHMLVFDKSRSKVKVKIPQKLPFLGQFWVQR